jgi:RNA polymerase sigma-70 factor (ECF subfamily)
MSEFDLTGEGILFPGQASTNVAAAPVTEITAEARLVARVRSGDRDAFGDLYARFAAMVHGILLARVPRVEVDDLAQDVFLSAYKNLGGLRNSNAFGPWLAMITRNRAMEFYRRERKTEELPEDIPVRASKLAEATEVLDIIRSLPDAYQETLVLRLVEGMTGPEIAERTGLKADSVRVNLHRGMKMLREKLGITEEG